MLALLVSVKPAGKLSGKRADRRLGQTERESLLR